MDPEANKAEQIELASTIQLEWDNCRDDGKLDPEQIERVLDMSNRLAELVMAMHDYPGEAA